MWIIQHLSLFCRKFAAFYLGCAVCLGLQTHARCSPVLASALVGLAGTFLPVPRRYDRPGFQAAIFAGSFAGMASPELLAAHGQILLLSALGAILYLLLQPHLQGLGGKLGAVAFGASWLMLLLWRLI